MWLTPTFRDWTLTSSHSLATVASRRYLPSRPSDPNRTNANLCRVQQSKSQDLGVWPESNMGGGLLSLRQRKDFQFQCNFWIRASQLDKVQKQWWSLHSWSMPRFLCLVSYSAQWLVKRTSWQNRLGQTHWHSDSGMFSCERQLYEEVWLKDKAVTCQRWSSVILNQEENVSGSSNSAKHTNIVYNWCHFGFFYLFIFFIIFFKGETFTLKELIIIH